MIQSRRPAARAPKPSLDRAHDTCDRLKIEGSDRAFFLSVFTDIRDRELAGEDTYHQWVLYTRTCTGADLAVAAYLEALAATRPARRTAS